MVARRYDFDGRSQALVPLASPWGIGMLAYADGGLTSPVLKPNGTRFDGWLLNSGDNLFRETGDFDGDGRARILVSSPWGNRRRRGRGERQRVRSGTARPAPARRR